MRSRPPPGRPLEMSSGEGRSGRGGSGGRRPDLVEARAAVDGPIVPGRERDDRLAAARAADRGVELARPIDGAGALGCCSAARATLRVVLETLAGEERLLPRGEQEFLRTVTTIERSILVHPGPSSSSGVSCRSVGRGRNQTRRWGWGCALGSDRARTVATLTRRIRAESRHGKAGESTGGRVWCAHAPDDRGNRTACATVVQACPDCVSLRSACCPPSC